MNDDATTGDSAPQGRPTPTGQPIDPPAGAIVSDPPPTPAATVTAPPPPPPVRTGADTPSQPPPPPTAATAPPGRPGLVGLAVAVGVGLLAAAVVLTTWRARAEGDLDWSVFAIGLAATAVLVVVAVVASARARSRAREELVTWPGSIGILGVAAMLGVGLHDAAGSQNWLSYLIGGVVVVLSLLGYVLVRRGAFIVTAVVGLAVVAASLYKDVLLDAVAEDELAIVTAVAIAVFVLAVTALGWLLPTRALSGVVVGAMGVVAFNALLVVLVWVQLVAGLMSGFGPMAPESSDTGGRVIVADTGNHDTDVYVILGLALVLTLLWALAGVLVGHSGFTVLAIAMPATTVPVATVVLAVESPTWWGVSLAVGGAVLLLLALLLARRHNRAAPDSIP